MSFESLRVYFFVTPCCRASHVGRQRSDVQPWPGSVVTKQIVLQTISIVIVAIVIAWLNKLSRQLQGALFASFLLSHKRTRKVSRLLSELHQAHPGDIAWRLHALSQYLCDQRSREPHERTNSAAEAVRLAEEDRQAYVRRGSASP
jgi:hypothetical protein